MTHASPASALTYVELAGKDIDSLHTSTTEAGETPTLSLSG